MITPYEHQEKLSDEGLHVLRKLGWVYLAMEERTGKSLTALLIAEKSKAKNILILTKKKALEDWQKLLIEYEQKTKIYRATNYHQAKKLSVKFDLVILDECHNYLSGYPKAGSIHREVGHVVYGAPIIYVSATPHAQGYQMLYHQFQLCQWSPWRKYNDFYAWHKVYGIPYVVEVDGIPKKQYDRTKADKILKDVSKGFIIKTRKELGFKYDPENVIHWVELSDTTKNAYNIIVNDRMINISAGLVICDSKPKLRTVLHQLEGGTMKNEDKYFQLKNKEKVDYILENFGDDPSLVIMYHFKGELTKLKKHFKKAKLLQATSNAEGVDLMDYDHLVIYSQDYSTARHVQRRARQCNMKRDKPIEVHFLLVRNAVSSQVYKTVCINKRNFVDSVFKVEKI